MAERALEPVMRSESWGGQSEVCPPRLQPHEHGATSAFVSASPVLILLSCLTAGGCAGFLASDALPPRVMLPPPEGKKLAELVGTAFKTAKLPGAPEVSLVRATHDAQWGDWVFCIKSNSSEESPKYAVLTTDNTILEVRSAVLIDGCDKETYHPIEITGQPGDVKDSPGNPPPRSSRQHRTRAP